METIETDNVRDWCIKMLKEFEDIFTDKNEKLIHKSIYLLRYKTGHEELFDNGI